MTLHVENDALHVRAPAFSFIKGPPLARLKDGRSVRFDFELVVRTRAGAAAVAQARQRFVLSYDLWEERFAVTQAGTPPRSASHLTTADAETWCLDQLTVPVSTLGRLGGTPVLDSPRVSGAADAIAATGRCGIHAARPDRSTEPAPERRMARRDRGRSAPADRTERSCTDFATGLIVAFLAATILPLAATIWITTSLLDRSLGYATTGELDRLSRTLESTVRQFYQRERDALKQEASAGRTPRRRTRPRDAAWPEPVRAFWESGEAERFGLSGSGGDHVDYLRPRRRRRAAPTGAICAASAWRSCRRNCARHAARRIRSTDAICAAASRSTLLLLLAIVWLVSLAPLVVHRAPHQPADSAADRRARPTSPPATGRAASTPAADAATKSGAPSRPSTTWPSSCGSSRERLVHLTQMASWQSLARKTAHELKNSLTPIRLTVEEMLARQPPGRPRLHGSGGPDRRQRESTRSSGACAPSPEFASEPPVRPADAGRQRAGGRARRAARAGAPGDDVPAPTRRGGPHARADADLVKGILTNLLQNAAEAAGPAGTRASCTHLGRRQAAPVTIEVHDSAPGLSRRGSRHALRADDHVQEARHGPRPVDREEERAALRRRHHARRRRARRRGIQGDAARALTRRDDPINRHIVVVDDEPNIGLIAAADSRGRRLRASRSASRSAQFQARTPAGRADLYLLDVRLPDGNGIDVLRALRQARRDDAGGHDFRPRDDS